MKNSYLEYMGYKGSVYINDEDQVLYGKVMFVPALLSYEGTDAKSLKESFQEAVDDYLQLCQEQGKEPAQPMIGGHELSISLR